MTDKQKRQKQEKIVTPKGVARYPWLNKPNMTNEKYKPVYSINLIMDVTDAQSLMDKLDAMTDEVYQNTVATLKAEKKHGDAKKVIKVEPYKMVYDEDGNETGKVEFRFKKNYTYEDKKTKEVIVLPPPKVFDAKGKDLPEDAIVFGGSTCKVSFTVNPYFIAGSKNCGVKLNLRAVQVLELVKAGGSASDFGFDEEEGYDSEDDKKPVTTKAPIDDDEFENDDESETAPDTEEPPF